MSSPPRGCGEALHRASVKASVANGVGTRGHESPVTHPRSQLKVEPNAPWVCSCWVNRPLPALGTGGSWPPTPCLNPFSGTFLTWRQLLLKAQFG